MENIDRIIHHPLFRSSMTKIRECEEKRKFCCHGIEHSLDVARMAYINNLEQALGFSKDMIYAAALLHDIGRWKQYADNTPHEEAGAAIAAVILEVTSFNEGERQQILDAIGNHREKQAEVFSKLLYQADKQSRVCWLCEAQEACYWPDEKKNRTIRD